ncbi:MAG: cyclase family protein [Actinobacteria bacterium]|nr:cyclase family protein [Actinomycetota bacterium]
MCGTKAEDPPTIAARIGEYGQATKSPFGADDQLGMLNTVTPSMREAVMDAADARDMYDLAVDLFIGMPAYTANGDPPFQMCLTHTPAGSVNEDPESDFAKSIGGLSGDVVSMYTHTGTHIDSLNHFGYGDAIWNDYRAETELGSRSWKKCGPENTPPVVTRGVLLDVPRALGVESLPDSFGIGPDEVELALALSKTEIRPGDAVVFRTGRMRFWPDPERFNPGYLFPGLNLEGAQRIAEAGAVMVGTDCMAPEQSPSTRADNPAPVHSYLLATCGVPIAENLWLEDLAREEIYEFAFLFAPIKFRGATGAPIRPIAFPLG